MHLSPVGGGGAEIKGSRIGGIKRSLLSVIIASILNHVWDPFRVRCRISVWTMS